MHIPKMVLVILDGWGYSKQEEGNAIFLANTNNFNTLWNTYPRALLHAFGKSVGLPWGATGSSEVGHKSIGSGKKIAQEYSKIDEEITSKEFFNNKKLEAFLKKLKKKGGGLHLIGLLSDGGVHSHTDHLCAILEFCKNKHFTDNIFLHIITDGRDCDSQSAKKFLVPLRNQIKYLGVNVTFATVSGRLYAMDRNNNWDRTERAYQCMTKGIGAKAESIDAAIDQSYAHEVTDEFIEPMVLDFKRKDQGGFWNKISGKKKTNTNDIIREGDGVLFYNIRADRMRQIVQMFLGKVKKSTAEAIKGIDIMTMITYDYDFPVSVIYPTEKIKKCLAKLISDNGYTQGHFAETEKYAHVTYFFNGSNPEPFSGEEWHLIPSPNVKTYDMKPEMSAREITDKVFSVLAEKNLDFVLINYANADMVGHTGDMEATIKAVECLDKEIARLAEAFKDTTMIITADHGNADYMLDPDFHEVQKVHSTNPVPFILVNKKLKDAGLVLNSEGILADITATIIELFGFEKPSQVVGISLMYNYDQIKDKIGKLF